MSRANPLWGAPRIHGELLKLGIDVSEATVSKYMIKRCRPPSQTWRTFLINHAKDIIALDFLTVPKQIPDSFCPDHSEPRSAADTARQCDGASDSGLDCAAAIRVVRLRRGAPISATRSRHHLRSGISPPGRRTRNQRSHDRRAITLAESICRTGHWHHTAGMSGSHDYSERAASQADSVELCRLLPWSKNAPVIGKRCTWREGGSGY